MSNLPKRTRQEGGRAGGQSLFDQSLLLTLLQCPCCVLCECVSVTACARMHVCLSSSLDIAFRGREKLFTAKMG